MAITENAEVKAMLAHTQSGNGTRWKIESTVEAMMKTVSLQLENQKKQKCNASSQLVNVYLCVVTISDN